MRTKLERLREQGTWSELELPDGRKVPSFVLPTPELQVAFDKELEKKLSRELKAAGFERLCATHRNHPFHSELLRERIDKLAPYVHVSRNRKALTFSKDCVTPESAEKARRSLKRYAATTKNDRCPLTKREVDIIIDEAIQETKVVWSAAFNKYRELLNDPRFWKNTYVDRIINPKDGPPLPDGPPPKPVFTNEPRDRVVMIEDGWVSLFFKGEEVLSG